MKKQLFGLSGTMMAVLLVAGCASDPLDDLRDVVSSVSTSLSYTELLVGASIEGRAQARDAQGNALATLPDISSANTAVASVTDDPRSGAPEPTKIFSILATGFGITTITASAGGNTADITVQTFPASVAVTGIAAGTQVTSGSTVQLAAAALATDGSAVAGGPSITWASDDASTASVDATGLVTALAPGLAVITATTDGGAVGQASFEVIPLPFPGTISRITGFLSSIVTLTQVTGGAAFDSDTQVDFDGTAATILSVSATQLVFTVPVGSSGSDVFTVTVSNIDSGQLTQTFDFTVVTPPAFAGTLSKTSGTIDENITLTIAAGDPAVDSDTEIRINGAVGATVSTTATVIVFEVPPSLAPGTYEGLVVGLGSVNDAFKFSFDVTAAVAFTGTVSSTTPDALDIITITPDPARPWDGDEIIVGVGGLEAFIVSQDLASAVIVVPSQPATGPVDLEIRKDGDTDLNTIVSLDMQSVYTQNDDPTAAPDITAGPFPLTMYISLDEDNPDDFFTIAPVADLDVTATFEWQNSADMDILWFDDTGLCCFFNFDGATGANPEVSSAAIPAGFAAVLNANAFDMDGNAATIVEITITSP